MSITAKIILRKKIKKDGTYPVALRVTKRKRSKIISLNMFCNELDFENEQFKKTVPNYRRKNQILLNLKLRALEIIDDHLLKGKNLSLENFEAKFRGIEKSGNTNVIDFFDEIITEMVKAGRISNSNAYKETKVALIKFKGNNILFEDVTSSFLDKFEVFLRERGNRNGGIAFKMRELRALFNKAINRDIISQDIYPFKTYKISKLKSESRKRALSLEDFKKIRDVDLTQHPYLIEAHNYFFFSVYTRGMNFQDMMMLKWEDIMNGRIYYTRSKTKGKLNLKIIDKAQKILDYYKNQERTSGYVFPILLKNDLTPKQIANRKHKVLSRYNRKLREIAKLSGVETHLTSYVARHSFATILKKSGTSIEKISEMMGHKDVSITMTYLKDFEDKDLDKENELFNEI